MNKEVLASHVADIEAGMKEYMPEETGYQKTVFEAMNYSLLAGGKRLRPMFLYEAYQMFGGRDEKAVRPFMMALEMIHTYSLVHDDLPAMDNDEYRRGKLTTHKKFGEAMGILAGDALLNGAFETAFLAFDSETEAAQIGRALKILGRKAGVYGMVGGQVVDVEKEGCFMDEDMLYFVHKNKTSALIESALMTGAVLAGANEKQAAVMEQCGTDIGLAFQIQDDILDVIGDQEKLGKPVHSDEKNEKTTAVSVYGIDVCRQKVKDYTDRGIKALEALDVPGKEHQKFLVELMKSLVEREM
ncbi:MAG: farnesyl diphosphate synthase [Eubacterium sp.]|nr:farnesyl diphosphate synthase [Eubacterium sp.]